MTYRDDLKASIMHDERLVGDTAAPDPMEALNSKVQAYQAYDPKSPLHAQKRKIKDIVEKTKKECKATPAEQKEADQNEQELQEALDVSIEQNSLIKALRDEGKTQEAALLEKEQEIEALLQAINDEIQEAHDEIENHPDDKQYQEKLESRLAKLESMHQQTSEDLNAAQEVRTTFKEVHEKSKNLLGGKPPPDGNGKITSMQELNDQLKSNTHKTRAENAAFAGPIAAIKKLYSNAMEKLSSIMDRTKNTKKELEAMKKDKPEPSSDLRSSLK